MKKESRSKWSRIIHNFLNSGLEIIKLDEPYSPENTVICLKHYLDGKNLPVTYAKRGQYIYIYRTDCTKVTVEEAMEGKYVDKDSFSNISYCFERYAHSHPTV